MAELSMAGTGGLARGGERHRHATIRKVENGYQVSAAFVVEELDWQQKPNKTPRQLEYVFYTETEALDFIRQYLEADSMELKK